jgi:hypothetical protein
VATTSTGAGTFARPAGAAGGTCAAGTFTLAANASCTINITYAAPATPGASATGTVTIGASVPVVNSPVTLTGSSAARTYTASIGPSPLAFGNWANGTTSSTLDLHVLNTGNSALTNFTYTLPAGTRFTRVVTGTFAIPNCPTTAAGTLAPGASCTIRYSFAPNAVASFSSTLTVGANGGTAATTAVFTPANVTLTGTGVATRATMSVTPNPLTITLGTGTFTNTGTVTLTNTAAAGGSNVAVTAVAVANGTGGGILSWFFSAVGGTDSCTGATLPPGGSCTVGVRFTNVLSARGVTRAGTITFTDTGAASPQTGVLNGFATP